MLFVHCVLHFISAKSLCLKANMICLEFTSSLSSNEKKPTAIAKITSNQNVAALNVFPQQIAELNELSAHDTLCRGPTYSHRTHSNHCT